MRKAGCIIWALCIVAAVALYVFSGTNAAAALLMASAVLPPVQILLAAAAARYVSAEFTMPATVQKGKPVSGVVVLRNSSFIPIAKAQTDIEVVNLLTREKQVFTFSGSVMPGSSLEMPFIFDSPRCGQLVFSRTAVRVCDCLGLCTLKSRERAPAPFRRTVVPELFVSNVLLSSSESSSTDDAERYLDKKGRDYTEVFQIRDYAEGDSQKQVLWKLTARFGKLIVSDPAEPVSHNLLIFWDGCGIPQDAPPSVPDALAEALFTVCISLAESDVPFSLAWQNPDAERIDIKDITCLNDMYDVTSALLAPHPTDNALLTLSGSWQRIVYFSGRVMPMPVEQGALISAFICVSDISCAAESNGNVTVFSPDDYQITLADVII